ncbi:hemolysin family protein [Pseudactinotalea sp. Z1748]|uniref:hemolysin family protein n=1 Tax=Pseudactinotalea sp. Z1748 TaxID=3413027 RepID=UPI003C7CA801
MDVLLILLALVLVACGGGFVAAEFALITVPRSAVEKQAATGDRRAKGVLVALRTLSTQLSGAQLGITVTNLLLGWVSEPAIGRLLQPVLENVGIDPSRARPLSLTLALIMATGTTMIFAELVPKNLAIARPLQTARFIAGYQRVWTTINAWPIRFFNGTANRIVRLLGMQPQEELASARSAEELSALVRHSARSGTLAEDTAELVARSLEFGDLRASEAMRPRSQIVSLSPDDTLADLVDAAKTSGYSRFPVLQTIQDNGHTQTRVDGLVHVRGTLKVPFEQRATTPVSAILTEATLVPESLELDQLMDDLRSGGLQMALVIDEFGDLDGLVTLEDLVEEIVGEVRDEHDAESDPVHSPDGSWDLSGLLRVDEASEVIGIELPEDEAYDTLGGLIADLLDRLAEAGDEVTFASAETPGQQRVLIAMTVLQMDGHRVDRLRLRTLGPYEPPEPEGDGEPSHADEDEGSRS